MSRDTVTSWVESYRRAWESNDPAAIADLFTPDAAYLPGPFDPPWTGRETIVREWLGRRDEPGQTTFRYEVLAAEPGVGVVRGWTSYREPDREYSNVWLIRLAPDRRCHEFTSGG